MSSPPRHTHGSQSSRCPPALLCARARAHARSKERGKKKSLCHAKQHVSLSVEGQRSPSGAAPTRRSRSLSLFTEYIPPNSAQGSFCAIPPLLSYQDQSVCARTFCGVGRECVSTDRGEPVCRCLQVNLPELKSLLVHININRQNAKKTHCYLSQGGDKWIKRFKGRLQTVSFRLLNLVFHGRSVRPKSTGCVAATAGPTGTTASCTGTPASPRPRYTPSTKGPVLVASHPFLRLKRLLTNLQDGENKNLRLECRRINLDLLICREVHQDGREPQ